MWKMENTFHIKHFYMEKFPYFFNYFTGYLQLIFYDYKS